MIDEELLTRFTCQNVILRAAQILAAEDLSDEAAAGFEFHGWPEPTLCRVDGRAATSEECFAYDRWRCFRTTDGSGLLLVDCIAWLIKHLEHWDDEDEGEDSVTYDEVLEVVMGEAA